MNIRCKGKYLIVAILLLNGCTYKPPDSISYEFKQRAETRTEENITVTAVVLSDEESKAAFATPLAQSFIQPVWLEIDNQQDDEFLLQLLSLDPGYFAPAEAAWRSRQLGEGDRTAKMTYFYDRHMPVLIPPKCKASGFVYTNHDPAAKAFVVELIGENESYSFEFVQVVPGFEADYMRTKPWEAYKEDEIQDLDLEGLRTYLEELPPCVLGGDRKSKGDPLNLVLVGDSRQVIATLVRRGWDLTETITAGSAWQTGVSSAFGSRYRTAPISALYVFDRPQDIGLQKARETVDERNHLRLWRAPVTCEGQPVLVGQVSRDIGVKLSSKTVVTHKIDPVVDEARLYVLLDIVASGHLARVGHVKGVGEVSADAPRYNYTLDPYWTDGFRAVLFVSEEPVALDEIDLLEWEHLTGKLTDCTFDLDKPEVEPDEAADAESPND
jgi:hypothetical protein